MDDRDFHLLYLGASARSFEVGCLFSSDIRHSDSLPLLPWLHEALL